MSVQVFGAWYPIETCPIGAPVFIWDENYQRPLGGVFSSMDAEWLKTQASRIGYPYWTPQMPPPDQPSPYQQLIAERDAARAEVGQILDLFSSLAGHMAPGEGIMVAGLVGDIRSGKLREYTAQLRAAAEGVGR